MHSFAAQILTNYKTIIMQNEQQLPPPPAQMLQMITGFWTSCCIYAAARLSIADALADGAKSAATLAQLTKTNEKALYRLLRALCSVGVFTETAKGFELTPLGNTLRSNVPGSMRAMAIAQLGDHFNAWGDLLYSVKTGNIAFDNIHGMSIWKYYETHPEDGANFTKAMAGLTMGAVMNILPVYSFNAFKNIVDIGGGNGTLLTSILKNAPGAKGIVLDEAYLEEQAKSNIAQSGMSDRCTFQKGSFFETIPEGADAYVLKMILHDWNDADSVKILSNINKAMKKGSKLIIIEAVISEGNTPHPAKFLDINMLAMTGGRERTEKEWKELIGTASLKFNKVVLSHSPMFSLIEVEKA